MVDHAIRTIACLALATVALADPAGDPVTETIRRELEAAGQPATLRFGDDLVESFDGLGKLGGHHAREPIIEVAWHPGE